MAKRSSKSTAAMPMVDREWQARNDLDTVRRAGEVMADRARMAAVQRMHHKEMAGMKKVMGHSLNLDKKR